MRLMLEVLREDLKPNQNKPLFFALPYFASSVSDNADIQEEVRTRLGTVDDGIWKDDYIGLDPNPNEYLMFYVRIKTYQSDLPIF